MKLPHWIALAAAVVAGSALGQTPPPAASTAPPVVPKNVIPDIKARGKLIVGVKFDVRLFGLNNPITKRVEGFDADIARAMAKAVLGGEDKVELVEAISANRIPFLQEDKVDLVISTMTITDARRQQIDFSDVYYVAGQSLLVPKGSAIRSIKDCGEKTVTTVQGSTSERELLKQSPTCKPLLLKSYSECFTALQNGQADAFTTDDIILLGWKATAPDKFELVGGLFTTEPYGIGVKKGKPDLLAAVNKELAAMKADGRWKALYEKHLKLGATTPTPQPPPAEVAVAAPAPAPVATAPVSAPPAAAAPATVTPPAAVAAPSETPSAPPVVPKNVIPDIKARGKLIVGVKFDVRLFGLNNPITKRVEGFDADIARAMAKAVLGGEDKVELVEAISANRIPFLQEDKVDLVISTMTITDARRQQIDFSDVYYVAGQSLLVPKGSAIRSIKDCGEKTVTTVQGSTSERELLKQSPTCKPLLLKSYSECFTALQNGQADAFTTDDIILLGWKATAPDKFELVGGLFTTEPYGIGVKKGKPDLLTAVNKELAAMKADGRWKALYEKHLKLGATTATPAPPK